jgi:hypothetical protein
VAVVLTLVQTKQIRINIHKRNNTKAQYKQYKNTTIHPEQHVPTVWTVPAYPFFEVFLQEQSGTVRSGDLTGYLIPDT